MFALQGKPFIRPRLIAISNPAIIHQTTAIPRTHGTAAGKINSDGTPTPIESIKRISQPPLTGFWPRLHHSQAAVAVIKPTAIANRNDSRKTMAETKAAANKTPVTTRFIFSVNIINSNFSTDSLLKLSRQFLPLGSPTQISQV